jgi:hypothetical protein
MLKAAWCERTFSEKASGKSTKGRSEFEKLKRALLPGDTIVVTKLARSPRSIVPRPPQHPPRPRLRRVRLRLPRRSMVRHDHRRGPSNAHHYGRHRRVRAGPYPQAMRGGIERAKPRAPSSADRPPSTLASADALLSATRRARPWPPSPASMTAAKPPSGAPFSSRRGHHSGRTLPGHPRGKNLRPGLRQ